MDNWETFQKRNYLIKNLSNILLKGLDFRDLEILFLLEKFKNEGKFFKNQKKLKEEIKEYKEYHKEIDISLHNGDFSKRMQKLIDLNLITYNRAMVEVCNGTKQGFLGVLIPNLDNLTKSPPKKKIEIIEKFVNLIERPKNPYINLQPY